MTQEPTKLSQAKRWFENQPIFVVLAILIIGYITFSKLIKATDDIKEASEQILPVKAPQEEEIAAAAPEIIEASRQIIGLVFSEKEGLPLKGAKVELLGSNLSAEYTDDAGRFIFREVSPGKSGGEVLVQKEGFESYNRKFLSEENVLIDLQQIRLKSIPVPKKKVAKTAPAKSSNKKIEITGGDFSGPTFIGNEDVKVEINEK